MLAELKDWVFAVAEWITMRRLRRRLVKVIDHVYEGDGTSDRTIELGIECGATVVKRRRALEVWLMEGKGAGG